MPGRPTLIWLVTVRSNDATGCHVYGVYTSRPIALQVKDRLQKELSTIQQQHEGFIVSQHWVNAFSLPVYTKDRIDKAQLEIFRNTYRLRVVTSIP